MLASLENITRSWKGVVLQSDVASEQKQAKFLHALPMQPPLLCLVHTPASLKHFQPLPSPVQGHRRRHPHLA